MVFPILLDGSTALDTTDTNLGMTSTGLLEEPVNVGDGKYNFFLYVPKLGNAKGPSGRISFGEEYPFDPVDRKWPIPALIYNRSDGLSGHTWTGAMGLWSIQGGYGLSIDASNLLSANGVPVMIQAYK